MPNISSLLSPTSQASTSGITPIRTPISRGGVNADSHSGGKPTNIIRASAPVQYESPTSTSGQPREDVRGSSPPRPGLLSCKTGQGEALQWGAEEEEGAPKEESTWLSRVQHKTDELRRLFELPATENVLEDFHCALQKTILLQGRMYVFEHYVCFYSNLFGYSKAKTIPLKDVTSIRKKKNYGFPNSIEVTWRGKKEFFTSFLSRDDAYRLLLIAWHQSSGYAKLFGVNVGDANLSSRREKSLRKYASVKGAASACPAPGADGSAGTPTGTQTGSISARFRPPADEDDAYSSDASAGPSAREEEEVDGADKDRRHESESEGESPPAPEVFGEYTVEEGPPPAVPVEMVPAVSGVLNISVKDFYQRFLSDESKFFLTFHEGRNDRKVQLSDWRQQYNMGRVRELQFVSDLKSKLGPPQAHCVQTQRYRFFGGDHLMFETSQVMNDIPFGDHFTVETRWDVTALPPTPSGTPQCRLQTFVAIPFSKNTIWKKAIEKQTMDRCKEAQTDWLAQAQKVLDSASAGAGEPTAATQAAPPRRRTSDRNTDDVPDIEDLLSRADPEFRADVARMLKAREDLPTPRRSLAAEMDVGLSMKQAHSRQMATNSTHTLLASYWQPLLAFALVLIIVLEVAILLRRRVAPSGEVWAGGAAPRTGAAPLAVSGGADFWLHRVSLLQGELSLLQQRMQLLQADIGLALQELRALANSTVNNGSVPTAGEGAG